LGIGGIGILKDKKGIGMDGMGFWMGLDLKGLGWMGFLSPKWNYITHHPKSF